MQHPLPAPPLGRAHRGGHCGHARPAAPPPRPAQLLGAQRAVEWWAGVVALSWRAAGSVCWQCAQHASARDRGPPAVLPLPAGIQKLWTCVPPEVQADMERQGVCRRVRALGCHRPAQAADHAPPAPLHHLLPCRAGRRRGGGRGAGLHPPRHPRLPHAAGPGGGQAAAVLGAEGTRGAAQLPRRGARLLERRAGGAAGGAPGAGAAGGGDRRRQHQRRRAGRGPAGAAAAAGGAAAGGLPQCHGGGGAAAGEAAGRACMWVLPAVQSPAASLGPESSGVPAAAWLQGRHKPQPRHKPVKLLHYTPCRR